MKDLAKRGKVEICGACIDPLGCKTGDYADLTANVVPRQELFGTADPEKARSQLSEYIIDRAGGEVRGVLGNASADIVSKHPWRDDGAQRTVETLDGGKTDIETLCVVTRLLHARFGLSDQGNESTCERRPRHLLQCVGSQAPQTTISARAIVESDAFSAQCDANFQQAGRGIHRVIQLRIENKSQGSPSVNLTGVGERIHRFGIRQIR